MAGTDVAGTLLAAGFPASTLLVSYAAWRTPERSAAVSLRGWATVAVPSLFVLVAIALMSYDSFHGSNDLAVILVELGATSITLDRSRLPLFKSAKASSVASREEESLRFPGSVGELRRV